MSAIAYPFVASLVRDRSAAGSVTVDLGCGAGQYRAAANGQYIGVDLPASEYGRTPDLYGDGASLPLRNASVNLVFGVASIYFMSDPTAVLRECRRVLRPDGSLLVIGFQPEVIARQPPGPGRPSTMWTGPELERDLRSVGFRQIDARRAPPCRIPDEPIMRSLGRRLRWPSGRWGIWLVLEARP